MIHKGTRWKVRSDADRLACFLDKVTVGHDAGCWVWTGGRGGSVKSYGTFYDGSHTVRAHRWSYRTFVGDIPAGLVLDHTCRNRLCVNPKHLEPVTQDENVRRGARASMEHCHRGHAFTAENTRRAKSNRRECRECARIGRARRKAVNA